MKSGAVDFLLKPFTDDELLDAVYRALVRNAELRLERREIGELERRARRLTRREKEVCSLVVAGRLNKQIAAELGTSEKTVKVHRSRVMSKMQAASLAELVRSVERLSRAHGGEGLTGAWALDPRETLDDSPAHNRLSAGGSAL